MLIEKPSRTGGNGRAQTAKNNGEEQAAEKKNFVNWDKNNFMRLNRRAAGRLTSRFAVKHGMLHECPEHERGRVAPDAGLISNCHETPKPKKEHTETRVAIRSRSLLDRTSRFIQKTERVSICELCRVEGDGFSIAQPVRFRLLVLLSP